MKNVEYVSASAGSGKTHTLTHKLVDLIRVGEVRPDQVILTTFTKAAAAEFSEKVKSLLYAEGLYDEALRFDRAMVGTVHSVCRQFVDKYWFFLGLVPDMDVMEDKDTSLYVSRSLVGLPTKDELKVLHRFADEFSVPLSENNRCKGIDYDFWMKHLKAIIEFSTNYEINDYSQSVQKSVAFIKRFVKSELKLPLPDELKDLLDEHKRFLYDLRDKEKAKDDKKNKETDNDKRIKTLDALIASSAAPTISWYRKLAELMEKPVRGRGELAGNYVAMAEDLMRSTQVFNLQEEYIQTIFKLAARWRKEYAKYKKDRNILDYNDMEKYMLELLQNEVVRDEIRNSFTHLFVDEFQDCSPMQVKIFDSLSEIMEQSCWVGDFKQSIYGFRGSDIALVNAVVDKIGKGGDGGCRLAKPLDKSYRSLPDIVNTCNHIFAKTFNEDPVKKNVSLTPVRKNVGNVDCLRYFRSTDESGLADHVARLIREEEAAPDDIGVLARDNKDLQKIADGLRTYHIPVAFDSAKDSGIVESLTYILVSSLLRIAVNPGDAFSKMQVAWLTQEGLSLEDLVNKRTSSQGKVADSEYLADAPLVVRLLALCGSPEVNLKRQGVAAMVESLVLCLGLRDVVKSLDEPEDRSLSCLQTIINSAKTYENYCGQTGSASTVRGFLEYMEEKRPPVVSGDNGVRLFTYHGAKGLQFKYLFLSSLDEGRSDDKVVKNDVYGVHYWHVADPSAEELYPGTYITVIPWIFGNKQLPDEGIKNIVLGTPEFKSAKAQVVSEANRLIYVGMTRPKDVMVLEIKLKKDKDGKVSNNPLQWFDLVGCKTTHMPANGDWDIFSTGKSFKDVTINGSACQTLKDKAVAPARRSLPEIPEAPVSRGRRDISPSRIPAEGEDLKISEYVETGKRITLKGSPEMDLVGDCLHQVYSYIEEIPEADLAGMIGSTVEDYGLSGNIPDPGALVEAWKRLCDFVACGHGAALRTWHERPFRLVRGGQVFTGSMDLVWQTADGVVLIDYKTCPRGRSAITDSASEDFAGLYAGQQNLYAEALEAAGENVLAKYLYYPVSGLVVTLP
jgi:ATP-dependent helicase/nuclease subunit A